MLNAVATTAVATTSVVTSNIFPENYYGALEYFAKNILELEGIMLAIMGVFALFLYRKAKENLGEEVRRITKGEAEKIKKDLTQRLVKDFALSYHKTAIYTWRKYKKRDLVSTEKMKKKIDEQYLEGMTVDALHQTLKLMEEALPYTEHKDFWEKEENKDFILKVKNNIAWYISFRKNPSVEEKKEALSFAKELYEALKLKKIPNYHRLDTVAWIFKLFPLTDKERKESKKIVEELKQRTDIPQSEKEYIFSKYKSKSR